MALIDLIRPVEYCIISRSYRKDKSRPIDAIDNYVSARYKEIKELTGDIDNLRSNNSSTELLQKMARARYLVRNLSETIRYLKMYEKLVPEEFYKLKEEGIPDVITDMILFEIDETLDDFANFSMN